MITYEFAVLIGTLILLAYIVFAIILKRKAKRIIVTCIFIIYLIGVGCLTLFPIVYDDLAEYTDAIMWYNFIPFKTIFGAFKSGVTQTAIIQIFGNILLSVPFGIFAPMLFKIPHWQQKLLIALLFTVSIELMQLIIGLAIGNMYRNIDIDDIILNLLGAFLGYAIFRVIPEKVKKL